MSKRTRRAMVRISVLAGIAWLVAGPALAEALPHCGFAGRVQSRRALGAAGETVPADVRPPTVGSRRSAALPLVVHWQDGVTPEYVEEILKLTEDSWLAYERLGFLLPHPDSVTDADPAFDIYIVTTLDPGIGGYAGFSGYYDATPRADAVGYLVINNGITPRLRRFVVAHELFHASQMAYDWWEDLNFMEASATWAARRAFADDDIWWRYVPFYNAEPWKALDFISIMAPYQYGAALYSMYLDERHGQADGSLIRRIWEGAVQDGMDNEPDFLDVATGLLGGPAAFDASFSEFGEWRALLGARRRWARFEGAGSWAETTGPAFEAAIGPGMREAAGAVVQRLQPWSHAFLSLKRPAGETGTYEFEITSPTASRLAVRWVALLKDGRESGEAGVTAGGETLRLVLPARSDLEEYLVSVANLTDGLYDADTSPWTGVPMEWRFRAVPGP